jgi:hypothetical protein
MAITEQDYENLSAYLDGVMDESERAALERRLTAEPELRQELAALRQTVALVKTLPPLKAPRSYALTPEMAGKPADSRGVELRVVPKNRVVNFVLPILSAAASMVLILFGASLLLTGNASGPAFAPVRSFESGSAAATGIVALAASPTFEVTEDVTMMQAEEAADAAGGMDTADEMQAEPEEEMPAPYAAMATMTEVILPEAAMLVPSGSPLPTGVFDAAPATMTFAYSTPPASGGELAGTLASKTQEDRMLAEGTDIAQQVTPNAFPAPQEASPDTPTNPTALAALGMIGAGIVLALLSIGLFFRRRVR